MKKIILLATFSVLLFSCSKVKKGEFLISGTAKGIPNGKSVVLQTQNEMGMSVSLDSAKVKDGKFELKGKITEPTLYTVVLPEYKSGFPVILENAAIEAVVNKDSIQNSKVSGSYNNDELAKVLPEVNKIEKKSQALGMEFQNKNMTRINEAQQKQDMVALNQLNDEFLTMMKPNMKYYFDYVEKNPKSYVSVLLFTKLMGYAKSDATEINKLFNNLDPEVKKTKFGKQVSDALKRASAPTPPPAAPAPTAEETEKKK